MTADSHPAGPRAAGAIRAEAIAGGRPKKRGGVSPASENNTASRDYGIVIAAPELSYQ